MNEWASPWESNPPTPQHETVDDSIKPQLSPPPLSAPPTSFGYFDAFTNEASWGNDEEPVGGLRIGEEEGKGDAPRESGGGEWRGDALSEKDTAAEELTYGLAGNPGNGALDGYGNGNGVGTSILQEMPASETHMHNNGLLDLDDDTFFSNVAESSATSNIVRDHAQNHEVLDLMDDDFFAPAQDLKTNAGIVLEAQPLREEISSMAALVHPADDEFGRVDEILKDVQSDPFGEQIAKGDAVEPPVLFQENLGIETTTVHPTVDLDGMEDTIYGRAMSSMPNLPVEDEEVANTIDPLSDLEDVIALDAKIPLDIVEEHTPLKRDDFHPQDIVNIQDTHERFTSSEVLSSITQVPGTKTSAEEVAQDALYGEPKASNQISNIIGTSSDLDMVVVDVNGFTALAELDTEHGATEAVTGGSRIEQNTVPDSNLTDFGDIFLMNQNLAGTSQAGLDAQFENPGKVIPGNVTTGFGTFDDFGDFEESLEPVLPAQELLGADSVEALTADERDSTGIPIDKETAFELMANGPPGKEATHELPDDLVGESIMKNIPTFEIDKSIIIGLFPIDEPVSEAKPPEPIDLQIESTAARKTWYRISRQASMRYYNGDDFDDYVRVTWPGSAVQAEVTEIVNKWVVMDRQNGGSMFKARSKPRKSPSNLSETPYTDVEAPEKTDSLFPGLRISISKPPRSPTGFGWSSSSPSLMKPIPGPPSPGPGMTPRAMTPSQNLQVQDTPSYSSPISPSPAQPIEAKEPEAQDDDEFGIFVSSASPLPVEHSPHKAQDDFDEWFSSAGMSEEIPSAYGLGIEQHSTVAQSLPPPDAKPIQGSDLVGQLSVEPLPLQPTFTASPDMRFSSPAPSHNELDTSIRSSPSILQPKSVSEDELSAAFANTVIDSSAGSSHGQNTSIAAPAASKTPIMPDWFGTPLIPSKPQTPVSAERSFSPAPPSSAVDDWFNAPPPSNPASSNTISINMKNTTPIITIPPMSSSPAIPPPPILSTNTSNHQDTNNWFDDDDFATPQSNTPTEFNFSNPPQISLSQAATPYNASPFLPPPRPYSALSNLGLSTSKQRNTSTSIISSPLASTSFTMGANEDVETGEDNFDDDFGGFVSSPPPPVAVPSFGTAVVGGWSDGAVNDTSFNPYHTAPVPPTPVISLPIMAPAPTSTSPSSFGGLGLAFDTTFFETAQPSPLPPTTSPSPSNLPTLAPQPLFQPPPSHPSPLTTIQQHREDPWSFSDIPTPQATSTPFPKGHESLHPPFSLQTNTSITTQTTEQEQDPWDVKDDDLDAFEEALPSPSPPQSQPRETNTVRNEQTNGKKHQEPEKSNEAVDTVFVEKVIAGLPDWSWIL